MALLISVVLMFLEVFNGFTVISNYSETIFRDAGSTLSPALSTVILGIIIHIGAYSSTLLVEKAGRKILMTTSAMGSGISLSIMAVYSYLKDHGHDVRPFSWAPLLCLSAYMLLGSIGIFTLYFVIITEVSAQKVSLEISFDFPLMKCGKNPSNKTPAMVICKVQKFCKVQKRSALL
jgi:drug/metabolite transporter (DMT)-like permease